MLKSLPIFLCLFLTTAAIKAQTYVQYFDGADTNYLFSVALEFDTAAENLWQVGKPQKTIFHSASTLPSALVTDTINTYSAPNTSRVILKVRPASFPIPGILAVRWKQKLDLEPGRDGAVVEISTDSGMTWQNGFNNPYVYNFYGFQPGTKDTLANGTYAMSGTDTTWRDIWFCIDNSFFSTFDTVLIRLSLLSDSTDTHQEGWLIDNFRVHRTIVHTVKEPEEQGYLKVYPSPSRGIVHIKAEALPEYHIIERMVLRDAAGRTVQTFGRAPVKFYIDISAHPDGLYYLEVVTNKKSTTVPVVLRRD